MTTQTAVFHDNPTAEMIHDLLVDSIQDIKGKKIIKLDLRHLVDRPTDFFIICEGESNTQIRAITANMSRRMRDTFDIRPLHVEGTTNLTWVLTDYGSVVVHVFNRETRAFYDLESLWGDGKKTEYEDIY